jgi:hypothetical protein
VQDRPMPINVVHYIYESTIFYVTITGRRSIDRPAW